MSLWEPLRNEKNSTWIYIDMVNTLYGRFTKKGSPLYKGLYINDVEY